MNDIFIHFAQMNVVFLLNNSISMRGIPIDQLNDIMCKMINVIKYKSEEEDVSLSMRVIVYNSTSEFIIGNTHLGEDNISWTPLINSDFDCADLAGAIRLSNNALRHPFVMVRDCRPLIILISNGIADNIEIAHNEINKLKNLWDGKILRVAIAVNGSNRKALSDFASIGSIVHEDDSLEENVPLVLDAANLKEIEYIIKSLIGIPLFDEEELESMNDFSGVIPDDEIEWSDDDDWL